MVHVFSFHHFGSVERAQAGQKKSSRRDWLYIGAALAHESISVRAGVFRSRGGAKGCGTYSSTYVLDFLLSQGTSASAKQYSVQVIHIFISFHDSGPHRRPKLCRRAFGYAGRSRTRLTADFTNVLISIRRGRRAAE